MRRLVLAAALLASCLRDPDAFRCDRAGGDRACDSVSGARCVQGYCAAPVDTATCASGLRYTASAASPGACVVTASDASADAPPVDASDGTAPLADVVDATLPDVPDAPPADDVADVPVPLDQPAVDAPDVPALMDVPDAPDVPVVMDVPDAPDVRDVPAAMDVPVVMDVPAAMDVRDVPAVMDVPAARDVVVAQDVVEPQPPPVSWTAPLPNERILSNVVIVRYVPVPGATVTVRAAQGIDCSRSAVTTPGVNGMAQVSILRGYLCLRLEVSMGTGRTWISPWRHVVVMGRVISEIASPRWGRWPDFNNDGYADFLMASAGGVRVFRYTPSGGVASGESVPGPFTSVAPVALAAVGDMDGDGYGDAVIAWTLQGRRREVYLHRGGASGLGGPSLRIMTTASSTDDDTSFGDAIYPLGDRAGDGRTDVAISGVNGRVIRTFSLGPNGQLLEGLSFSASLAYTAFVSDADIDGDERPDIAYTTAGSTWVVFSGGTGTVQVPAGNDTSSEFGRRLALGSDIDGDGRSELVALVPAGDQAVVYRWNRREFEVYARASVPGALSASLVAAGDVNNDSVDDFVSLVGSSSVRLHRGGFTNILDSMVPWREPVGLILAGASDSDTNARVWGGGTATVAPNGFIVYPYNGSGVSLFSVNVDLGGPVTLVAR